MPPLKEKREHLPSGREKGSETERERESERERERERKRKRKRDIKFKTLKSLGSKEETSGFGNTFNVCKWKANLPKPIYNQLIAITSDCESLCLNLQFFVLKLQSDHLQLQFKEILILLEATTS